ncbi:hypothetical protein V2J09_012466, partial [Rumex salicifolius]
FDYNVHFHDVLEVNKTSYEQCSPKGLIHNVTQTDYCSEGMKAAVTAKQPLPPPPPGGAHRRAVMSLMPGFFVALVWLFAM